MLDFAYPYLLLLLLLIPLFIGLFVLMRMARKKKLKLFGRPEIICKLMPGVSSYKSQLKFILLMGALAGIIVAFARPWGGILNTTGKRSGIEVVMAVDASNSMLASSTANPDDASRMTAAKIMLERLISNMSNDKVGLVVFAGEAYQLIPASSDYASARSFLNSISPEEIPVQGTDIESAIKVARSTFSDDKNVSKAIVLLTDVEELDNPQGALKAVRDAAAAGIQVDVVGVGSTEPVTIPYQNGYFRDDEGNVVRTGLNAELGRQLAEAGKGVYVNSASGDALNVVQRQLRSLRQTTLSAGTFTVHEELYCYFAIAALALLVVDSCLGTGKNGWLDKFSFFKKGRFASFSKK